MRINTDDHRLEVIGNLSQMITDMKFFVVIAVFAMTVFFPCRGICGQNDQYKAAVSTKEEILAGIRSDLEAEEGILDTIPSLKADKDKAGNISYTYGGVKLEDMSRKDLEKLFARVAQSAVKIRTENIQRQLDIARRTPETPKTAAPVPRTAPAVPKIPQKAPQPPG